MRYDLSSDPLAYAEKSFDETRQLLVTLGQRRPQKGETYAIFTRRLRNLIRSNSATLALWRAMWAALSIAAPSKATLDSAKPFAPVPLAQQRRALDILNRRIFAPGAFAIPRDYFNLTEADPYDFDDPAADAAFPIREDIARVRLGVLNNLFSPDRLARIANTTWKFPSQTLGFPELFARVRQGVWGNLSASPTFSAEQRDLARAHLRILLNMATDKSPVPADARLTAFGELQNLKKSLVGPRQGAPDTFTRLFFADTVRRIDAALAKKPE